LHDSIPRALILQWLHSSNFHGINVLAARLQQLDEGSRGQGRQVLGQQPQFAGKPFSITVAEPDTTAHSSFGRLRTGGTAMPMKATTMLYQVETDKSTMDVESVDAGFLCRVLAPEGPIVKVGQEIARIADSREECP
jgi:hypothetical protein